MKKFLRRVGYILLVIFCISCIYPAFLIAMELENESQGQIFGDYYTFDSKTIFRDHEKGRKDLFSVISWDDADSEVFENLPEYPPSKWEQQDYVDVLSIWNKTIFQRPFNGKIRGAIFRIPDCNQVSFGPQNAVFFTADISFPRATYYSYDIDLKGGSITWHGDSYEPIISWPISSLDLSRYKITVNQALQIAEEQGGEKVRLANHNRCDLDITIRSNHRPGNWVITYYSSMDQFTALFSIEIDAKTGEYKVIANGGAGYYSFDPQQIRKSISDAKTDIFRVAIELPENNADLPAVSWTQEDYYQIAKAFNRLVLGQDLDEWEIHSLSFELDCDDALLGPQQMDFNFRRSNILNGNYFTQRIIINPRTGTVKWNNEYDYDVNPLKLIEWRREMIDKSWIKIPAEHALKIAYNAEGKHLHQALINNARECQMSGGLDNYFGSHDASTLEWNVLEWKKDYQLLGEQDMQLRSFIDIETGELRFFRFYGNLEQ